MNERVDFQIVREQLGTTVRLVISGELDLATAPTLTEQYGNEHRNGAEMIVLDLSGVTFMDSTGLHALLTAHEHNSNRLRIILSPFAARVIDITGARHGLPIIEG